MAAAHSDSDAAQRSAPSRREGCFDWRLADDSLWADELAWRLVGDPPGTSVRAASNFFVGVFEGDPEPLFALIDQCVTQPDETPVTCLLEPRGQSGRRVEIRLLATRDEFGKPAYVSGVIVDVERDLIRQETLQAQQNRLLERGRERSIDGLASGVAHEFNNVLQIIRGYVTFAWQSLDPETEVSEDLHQALIATDRAADLTTRLLRFARAEDESGQRSDVNEVVGDLSLLLRPIIGPEIEFAVACAIEPLPVSGYDASLRQAVLNLCVNARDAMPQGGRLLVRCERYDVLTEPFSEETELAPGAYCRVLVSDTGCGIPDEVKDSLFEPFFSTKTDRGGTGLGLAIVQQFVQRVGGAISVSSRAGRGTTFCLYLPLATQPRPIEGSKTNDIPIAVVSPVQSVGLTTCDLLRATGREAFWIADVESVEERLGAYAGERFALIADEVISGRLAVDCPTVILTELDESIAPPCVGGGIAAALMRPAEPHLLVAAIDRATAPKRTSGSPPASVMPLPLSAFSSLSPSSAL